MDSVTHEKIKVFYAECSKLHARVDGPSKIIKEIRKNAYKLKFPDEYNMSPTFSVKDLGPYHGEDLSVNPFFPNYGGLM